MGLILSIETATPVCSVALHQEGHLLACFELHSEKSHAEQLTLLIEQIAARSGKTLHDLSAIAVSKGPGSYTGLRIGVSVAKGICFVLDKPLLSVETLKAMAWGVNYYNIHKAYLCPMIDARRMEVYCAVYDTSLQNVHPIEAKIIEINSFEELLSHKEVLFFGNGALKCKEVLGHQKNALFIEGVQPSAAWIGQLAYQKFLENTFEDVAYFEPFYLKDFMVTTPKKNK